jgi:hypothetical protein
MLYITHRKKGADKTYKKLHERKISSVECTAYDTIRLKMYYHTTDLTYLVTNDSGMNKILQRLSYRKQHTGVADAIAGPAP